jgi:signal peptidase I
VTLPPARRVADAALTLVAVLGSLCLVVTVLAAVWGVRPLVFRSGSMSPAITTGALAFAHPVDAADLEVGDVVSVPKGDTRVTHRIAAISPDGDAAMLVLRGDANPVVDPEPYRVTTADRVVFAVPKAGRVVAWLSGPVGPLLGGMVAAGLLWVLLRPTHRPSGRRVAGRATATVVVLVAAGVAVPLAAGGPGLTSTWAAWTDQASATGSASGHTLASQAAPDCNNVGNIARLTWSHVDVLYQYAWELRTTGGAVVSSGVVPGGAQATGSTVTLDLGTGLIGTNANYNVVVRARLVGTPTWVAATTTTTPVRRASIIIIGTSMRCGHD